VFQLVLVEAFNVLNGFLLSDHCKAKTINDIKTKQTISAHLCLVLSVFCTRVPTGQGKLEKVREFEWSGKVRENAKMTGKSGKFWGKILPFCSCCNANNSRAGVQSTIL